MWSPSLGATGRTRPVSADFVSVGRRGLDPAFPSPETLGPDPAYRLDQFPPTSFQEQSTGRVRPVAPGSRESRRQVIPSLTPKEFPHIRSTTEIPSRFRPNLRVRPVKSAKASLLSRRSGDSAFNTGHSSKKVLKALARSKR